MDISAYPRWTQRLELTPLTSSSKSGMIGFRENIGNRLFIDHNYSRPHLDMTSTLEGVKISDISLINPRARSWENPKFHVKITFSGTTTTSVKTEKKRVDGDRITWNEPFFMYVQINCAGDITNSIIAFKVVRTRELAEAIIGTRKENVLDLLQLQIKFGLCRLEIGNESGQLSFSMKQLSPILPGVISEASKASADIPSVERPAKVACVISSIHDTVVDQEDTWSSFLSQFQIFMNAIDKISEVHGYAKLAWSILSVIPKTVVAYQNRNGSVKELCEKLKGIYDFVTDTERLPKLSKNQTDIISTLVHQTIECAYFIREYSKGNIVEKIWKSNSIDNKIKAFNDKFDHVKESMMGATNLETSIVTLRVSETVSEMKDLTLLNGMRYAQDAGFVSGKKCLRGTRETLIKEILEWVNGDTAEQVLVLSGQAGSGKSAVAHTIAEIFRKQSRLGSLFCFDRSYRDRRNFLFSTISRGLADGDVLWRKRLVKIIEETAIRTSSDIETQFNELIVKPSQEIATIGPVVIIIDALDECGDRGERQTLLDILFGRLSALPTNYRIVLTTRPETDIEPRCHLPTVSCRRIGDIPVKQTFLDIKSYVSFRLEPIATMLNEIERDWRDSLAERAEGLFQWAETVCRFINPTVRHPSLVKKRWKACTSTSSTSLYELYHQIISSQEESKDAEFIHDFKLIVCAIMAAREPLTVEALENIFKHTIEDVKMTLDPFGSLLLGVHDTSTPVRPLHTSLFDFFGSQVQAGAKENQYYVDTSDQSLFTLGCFKLLNGMLRFNMCNLETSHRRNRDIPDFGARVKEAIPLHLSYACRFWAFHLRGSHDKKGLTSEIRTLMHDKLLYLFEALSLLGEVEQGLVAMRIVNLWCKDVDYELSELALDAWHFAFEFGDVLMESTPHLYISALPFTPNGSFVSAQYLPLYPQLFSIEVGQSLGSVVETGFMKKTPSSVITSFVFSPQGRYIATASGDGEFWFGDYETGEVVYRVNPRGGIWICDIVFSPDGRLIYCCLRDGSVFTWNVQTKETVNGFYQEVLGEICLWCTVSSDGCYIVFLMKDTIILYDRKVHKKLMQVRACLFPYPVLSPNGDFLAFLRGDGVPCLWNTRRGELVHSWTDRRYGSFALNDRHIAFSQTTIEVWDVQTVTKVWEAEGFTGSLCFANDQYLLFFTNKTYGIWDVSTKDLIVMSSLDDPIQSIATSPDSKFIGIITMGNTIHVRQWDAPVRLVTSDRSENIRLRKLWLRGQYLVRLYEDRYDDFIRISNITALRSIPFDLEVISSSRDPVVAISSTDEHFYIASVTTSRLCVWDNIENEVVQDRSGADATTDSRCLFLRNNKGRTFVLDKSNPDVTLLGFSASGDRLISSDSHGVVQIWDVHSCALVSGPYTVSGRVNAVAFSETSARFLVAYESSCGMIFIEVRECRSGCISGGPFKSVQSSSHTPHFPSYMVTFSANETRIIYMSQSGIEVLDALTGKTEMFQPYPPRNVPLYQVSLNQKYAAWFLKRNVVELWNIDHAVPLQRLSSEGSMRHFVFSDDSAQIVMSYSTADGYYIDIWDIPTGKTTVKAIPIYGTLRIFTRPPLSLHLDHLVSAVDNITTILKLDVHGALFPLYEHHRNHSQFGMLPVDHNHLETRQCVNAAILTSPLSFIRSFGTLNRSTSEYTDTLEYALTAWNKALFSSMTEINQDGWMLGPHGELLIWVPKKRRTTFWRPSMVHIDAKCFTKLNFDKFVHGSRWAECKGNR